MSRVIAFVFCIAFLFWAGGWTRTGMAIGAAAVLALAGYAGWLLLSMFLGSGKR